MEQQSYEFKASNIAAAKKKGLETLGLTEEQAEIEVISNGGIFSKAIVRITPKESSAEEVNETAEKVEEVKEEIAPKKATAKASVPTSDEEEKVSYEVLKQKLEEGKVFFADLLKTAGGKGGFEAHIRDGELCFYIGSEDAKRFIGYKGETLEAIQVLVSHFINQKNEGPHISVIVDADFYRERRKKTLIAMARRLATQAFRTHREIALDPMNSYERRIIHTALQNSYEAETRSDGEGAERHVVIVPKNGQMSYGTDSSFRKKGPSRTKSYGYEKRKFF